MKKKTLLAIGVLAAVGLSWAGLKTSRAGYEGPEYEVVLKEGEFEVRRYATMVGARTASGEDGRNSGFGKLFKFITGANESGEKIAMTSPVFMDTDENANESAMTFVMPQETVEKGVPDPTGESVTVTKIPGGDFAALRFKGYRSKEAQREALATLRKQIAEKGLIAKGEPMFAYYDPPWTPEILRRNEVLLRVSKAKE